MKNLLLAIMLVAYSFMMISCTETQSQENPENTHIHEHGEECNHDHSHDEEVHNHEENTHEHDEDCDHDHSQEAHTHNEVEDTHEHGEDCDHDHENENEHNHDSHDHDHSGHEHGEEEANPDLVFLSPEQAEKYGILTVKLEAQEFQQIIKTSGEILPSQSDEMTITASHSGIVLFNGKNLLEGISIKRGASVVTLSSENMMHDNYQVSLNKAKALKEKLEKDFKRAENLIKDKLIAEKDYNEIKLNFEDAKREYDLLTRGYSKKGIRVNAPITGFISKIFVKEGDFVEAGQALMTVTKNKNLILKAELSQKNFKHLSSIRSANFITAYDNKFHSIEEHKGRLVSYGKNTDTKTFFTPLYFEIENVCGLVPGAYADIYLKSTPIENAMVIPKSAIIEQQGIYFVFVKTGTERYERKAIEIAMHDGEDYMIKSGLNFGDKIVTEGSYRVFLASQNTGGMDPHAGHSH